jgi:hypothetical protein
MPRPQVILPQADASCGKVFFTDRRTADGHRVALEVWNRATGRVREGYRLAVFRCKRCGGFHVGQRPVDRLPNPSPAVPSHDHDHCSPEPLHDWECDAPRVWRVSTADSVWS